LAKGLARHLEMGCHVVMGLATAFLWALPG
jgi:hypothetical protein